MLGNLSGSFLLLSAKQQGILDNFLPLVMVLQNLITSVTAFPFGKVADSVDRRIILGFGFLILTLSHLILGLSSCISITMIGIGFCGLQMGITQSVLAAFVTDTCPHHVRGTGFGFFHFINGMALLLANSTMGLLWDMFSLCVAFCTTASASLLSLVLLPWLAPAGKKRASAV